MSAEPNADFEPAARDSAPDATTWFDAAVPKLFGYFVTRVGGQVHLAEDLTQETVLAAIASRHPPAGGSPVMAWLYGIARHKLVDHYRREEREQLHFGRPVDLSAVDIGPSPPLGRLDLDALHTRDDIVAVLNQLPPRQRSAIALRYLDDLSVASTAQLLGLSEHATESLLARGRAAFRRHYHARTGGTS